MEVEWRYLINISRTLGTGLHECEHALTFTVSLRICSTNLSLALQVTLVTDQHLAYVFTSVSRVRWYFSGDGTLVGWYFSGDGTLVGWYFSGDGTLVVMVL